VLPAPRPSSCEPAINETVTGNRPRPGPCARREKKEKKKKREKRKREQKSKEKEGRNGWIFNGIIAEKEA
jgi:hypothetical protein